MLNSLDALVITFFAMSFISILGVILMFLTKKERRKKRIFYGLSIWGLIIAFCNVQTHFSYMVGGITLAIVLGLLAVAAVLIQKFGKSGNRFQVAQILTAISVAAGMADTFFM